MVESIGHRAWGIGNKVGSWRSGQRISDFGLRKGIEHRAWSMGKYSLQIVAGRFEMGNGGWGILDCRLRI